jgi:hypothetical protein
MSVTLTHPASHSHRSGNEDTHAVMYWVKRPAYELALAVPQASHAGARGARPRVCVRVKTPRQGRGFILEMPEVEQFYGDLLQMIEYMQSERRSAEASTP